MKKKILIIGGSGLIGSNFILKNHNNYKEIINLDIINNNKLQKINNYKFLYLDLSIRDNVEKEFNIILNNIRNLEYFINCSYITDQDYSKSNFKEIKYDNFVNNLNYNLFTYTWTAKLVLDYMKKYKKGSVVLLNSIYGILGQDLSLYKNTNMKENFTYSVAKGGITNAIRQFASYYGKYNIRVNSVCSGGIKGHIKSSKQKQSKNFIKNYSAKCPLGRLAKPAEISNVIKFLCSDESSYITGTNLIVDGGWSAI